MTKPTKLVPYRPKRFSPPGATIADILEERDMTQSELARQMGFSQELMQEVIEGKAAITPETARQLESVFGVPADYWLRHEALYRSLQAQSAASAPKA